MKVAILVHGYSSRVENDYQLERHVSKAIRRWLASLPGGATLLKEDFKLVFDGSPSSMETFVHAALQSSPHGAALMRHLRSTSLGRLPRTTVFFADAMPEDEWRAFKAQRWAERRLALAVTAMRHDVPCELAAMISRLI